MTRLSLETHHDTGWARAVGELIQAGQRLGARGWLPATSGNLSCRLDRETIAITASGIDKTALTERHILRVPMAHEPPPNASAETPLHLSAYRRDDSVGAVLHVHSMNATLISRRAASHGAVVLEGYELLKAFRGIHTHETPVTVPVFPNSQDISGLTDMIEARLGATPSAPGYLLAGHGLYSWGRDMAEALRHLEAFDFLFACALAEGAVP